MIRLTMACLLAFATALSGGSAFAAGPPAPALPQDWASPTGPYAVTIEEEANLPDHTIYRPADLAGIDRRHRLPVVAFAGPGCDFNGTAFRPFFTELASHGFLILVSGPPEPRGGSGEAYPKTAARDLVTSIDWAERQSGKAGKYRGKIDTAHVAVMGQSCGGLEALQIVGDPRIKTIVFWNSGVLNDPGILPPGVKRELPMSLSKDVLGTIHVPVAYFVGKTDIAYPNALDDFTRKEDQPVFFGALDIPGDAHAGTFRQHNGGAFGKAGVAWLKWQLKGDRNAALLFRGPGCGLCRDPAWNIRQKHID